MQKLVLEFVNKETISIQASSEKQALAHLLNSYGHMLMISLSYMNACRMASLTKPSFSQVVLVPSLTLAQSKWELFFCFVFFLLTRR